LGNKNQQMPQFWLFLSPNQFQNGTNCGSNKTPQLGSSSHNIPIFDNRRFLSQHPQEHNNRVFQATGRPTECPARLPTDGPAMPVPDSGRRLRCVAGFLDTRERLARRGACFALVDKTHEIRDALFCCDSPLSSMFAGFLSHPF
jgi:hypothetical protein